MSTKCDSVWVPSRHSIFSCGRTIKRVSRERHVLTRLQFLLQSPLIWLIYAFPPAEIPVDLEKVIVSNSWCEDPPNVPNAELPRADGTLQRETRGIVSSRKRLRSFLLREVLSSKTAELRWSSKTAQLTTVIKDCLVESCLKWSSH